ncbi:MAG: hypothetical protein QNK40_14365 [Desulfobacterales bacterium]|nr:hypothetical protein [Desulfobacterales bacterium]
MEHLYTDFIPIEMTGRQYQGHVVDVIDQAIHNHQTGILKFPHWGLPKHKLERSQFDWGYGTIFSDRDINEHCVDMLRGAFPKPITIYKKLGFIRPPQKFEKLLKMPNV